jgi:hypothetical protein
VLADSDDDDANKDTTVDKSSAAHREHSGGKVAVNGSNNVSISFLTASMCTPPSPF